MQPPNLDIIKTPILTRWMVPLSQHRIARVSVAGHIGGLRSVRKATKTEHNVVYNGTRKHTHTHTKQSINILDIRLQFCQIAIALFFVEVVVFVAHSLCTASYRSLALKWRDWSGFRMSETRGAVACASNGRNGADGLRNTSSPLGARAATRELANTVGNITSFGWAFLHSTCVAHRLQMRNEFGCARRADGFVVLPFCC